MYVDTNELVYSPHRSLAKHLLEGLSDGAYFDLSIGRHH